MNKGESGWTSLEAMIALIMALIAAGSLSAAAAQALSAGSRLRVKAAAIIESRNAESQAVLGLLDD